jgi:hypothetical protein
MTPGSDDFGTQEILSDDAPRRRIPRPLIFIAAAVVVTTTGVGVAAAAAFSPSPQATPSATATESPGDSPSVTPPDEGPGRGGGWGRRGLGMGGAVHGEFVVPDGQGKYVTVATQQGDVTAVDQSSVTVKSADGYSKTYAINGNTRVNAGSEGAGSVKTGDSVMVMATVSGQTATADSVFDLTRPNWPAWGGKGRWHRGGGENGQTPSTPETTPTPESTPTA